MADNLNIHGVNHIKIKRNNLDSCETIEINISSESYGGHDRDFNIILFSQDEKFPFDVTTIPSDVKVDLFYVINKSLDIKKEEEEEKIQ